MKYLLGILSLFLVACAGPQQVPTLPTDCTALVDAFDNSFYERVKEQAASSDTVASIEYDIVNVVCENDLQANLDLVMLMRIVGEDPFGSGETVLWCNKILSKFTVSNINGELVSKATYTKVLEIGPCK